MQTVTVEIYGEPYAIKTDDDPSYVREVASLVNTKMQEITATGKVVTTSKIAILAALNIADELMKTRIAQRESDAEAGRRIDRILLQLQSAIGD